MKRSFLLLNHQIGFHLYCMMIFFAVCRFDNKCSIKYRYIEDSVKCNSDGSTNGGQRRILVERSGNVIRSSNAERRGGVECYELSQEILDKKVDILIRKYGKEAVKASLIIQRAFRKYEISKRFRNLALNALREKEKVSQSSQATGTTTAVSLSNPVDLPSSGGNVAVSIMEGSSTVYGLNGKSSPENRVTSAMVVNSGSCVTSMANAGSMKRHSNASIQSSCSSSLSASSSVTSGMIIYIHMRKKESFIDIILTPFLPRSLLYRQELNNDQQCSRQ